MALYVSNKHHGNPEDDPKVDGVDDHAQSCPTLLDTALPHDSKAHALGVRRLAGQPGLGGLSSPNNDQAFAKASYNSSFFEGLFDDVASTNNDSKSATLCNREDLKSLTKDNAQIEPFKTVKSEHNLAKRRLVSTTQSLQERCGPPSVSNLFSRMSGVVSPREMTNPTAKNPMDLPVTVSASLSFQFDQTKSTALFADKSMIAPDPAAATITGTYKDKDEGEFGWFVETDPPDDNDGDKSIGDPYANLSIPLAFSAPTAPRASQLDHQAQVEWAQAADTVDEVLGELF